MLRYIDKYPYILIPYVFLYFSPVIKDRNLSLIPLSSLNLITNFKNDKIVKTNLEGFCHF